MQYFRSMNAVGKDINQIFIWNLQNICKSQDIDTLALARLTGIRHSRIKSIMEGNARRIYLTTFLSIASALEIDYFLLLTPPC